MDEETPVNLPEIDHQETLKRIADIKAALEDLPDDPHLKNALEYTKIVQHGRTKK